MNYYMIFLILAIFFGVLCFFSGNVTSAEITLSEIILYPAFSEADFFPPYVMVVTHWFMPLLIFQIIYGTYIYRHFCSASVYYFSRNKNRTKWFLKETAKLYKYIIFYLGLMLVTGVIVVGLQREIVVDGEAIVILIYYMLIHSLYLLATTLAINILSIQLSGIIAFGIVESINFVGIATYTLLGVLITNEAEIARRYAWVLKINPFAHLVFSVHSSCINEINTIVNCKGIDFDLNISVIFFLVMVFVVLESGCIIVNHCEFLTNSKEGM